MYLTVRATLLYREPHRFWPREPRDSAGEAAPRPGDQADSACTQGFRQGARQVVAVRGGRLRVRPRQRSAPHAPHEDRRVVRVL